MSDETKVWDKIYNDISELQSWETYAKVNVYELTSHLEILYNKIEELETQVKILQNQSHVHAPWDL
jgi:polyhydroxyalkanoate synthesis regulator phasin